MKYQHRKGGLYEVFTDCAIMEKTLERYVAYHDTFGRLWLRPFDEFFDGRFVPLDGEKNESK